MGKLKDGKPDNGKTEGWEEDGDEDNGKGNISTNADMPKENEKIGNLCLDSAL